MGAADEVGDPDAVNRCMHALLRRSPSRSFCNFITQRPSPFLIRHRAVPQSTAAARPVAVVAAVAAAVTVTATVPLGVSLPPPLQQLLQNSAKGHHHGFLPAHSTPSTVLKFDDRIVFLFSLQFPAFVAVWVCHRTRCLSGRGENE